jgi:hypothetical protein
MKAEALRRDLETERLCLERTEFHAAARTFAAHALDRLAAGEDVYGDRWTTLGADRLLVELLEEAADLGAWGVLPLQALEHDPELPPVVRDRVATGVRGAILCGAHAHATLERARVELDRAYTAPALARSSR